VIEDWSQWNRVFGFLHKLRINPYDPDKHVWVVNRDGHQIHKFTRDGKKLLMTLGDVSTIPGTDRRHFGSPTDIAFLPDDTFFVAEGYHNSRVVKFDKNGKFLLASAVMRAISCISV
jgi:DNA-binding beta-propeller fold protein YncE